MATPKLSLLEEQITELGKLRGHPILLLQLSDVKPMSVIRVDKELQGKNFEELDVILNTPGGHIESAYNIAKILRKHTKKLNVIVPYVAKSAGTLICLCADKIMLSTISELGPLDTQIREMQDGDTETYKSALNGFKALERVQYHALENMDAATKIIVNKGGLKMSEAIKLAIEFSGKTSGCLYNQLNPIIIGEYARALEVGQKYGVTLLTRYLGWQPEIAESAVNNLVYNYPSHGFCIDTEELKNLGLPAVEVGAPEEALVQGIGYELLKSLRLEKNDVKLIEVKVPSIKIPTLKKVNAKSK